MSMARNHSHPCHTVFFIYNALLLLSLSSVEGASRGGSGSQCALYEGFTDSRCLTSSNIDSSLRESKTGWVVEFYSSWCGHCHHFSPTWKKVASRIKGWYNVIQMGQIDCTHTDNRAICGLYHIEAFPTIKLFNPFTKDPHSKDVKKFLGRQSESALMEAIINHVSSQGLVSCLKPLADKLSVSDSVNVLVFEERKSLLGSEIILDFLTEKVKIRRVLPDNTAVTSQYSVLQFPSLVILPTTTSQHHTVITKNEATEGKDDIAGDTRLFFESKIKELVLNMRTEREETNKNEVGGAQQKVEAGLVATRATMTDILSAVSYCLRYEVTLKQVITGEDFYTLHQFLYHLEKVFHLLIEKSMLTNLNLSDPKSVPSDLKSVWNDLKSLYTKLSSKYSTGFLSSTEWQIMLRQKLHNESLPLKPEWRACAGSRPEFRGFPCGLWTLLHTATILSLDAREEKGSDKEFRPLQRIPNKNEIKREDTFTNKIAPKTKVTDDQPHSDNADKKTKGDNNKMAAGDTMTVAVGSREVLYAMSRFIASFFSCQTCREHFSQRFKSDLLSFPLSYDGDAIMWAWAVHNDVSWRLRDDQSNDPAHPKSLFPSYKTCPYCYRKLRSSEATPTWDNVAPPVLEGIVKRKKDVGLPPPPVDPIYEWNQTAVFLYLCHFYGRGRFDHTPHHVLVRAGWPRKYPSYSSDHYRSRLHGATPLSSLTILIYLLVAAVMLAYTLNFKLKRARFKSH